MPIPLDVKADKLFVGMLAAFFVLKFVASHGSTRSRGRTPQPFVFALGLLSGFSSFIAHAGGHSVKGYLLQQQLEKSCFVGTNTMFFFAWNFLQTIAYGAIGTLSASNLQTSAVLSPILLLGVFAGFRLDKVVDQDVFVKVVYGFLALTAIKLLYGSGSVFLR